MITNAYYVAPVSEFVKDNAESILNQLEDAHSFDLNEQTRNSWKEEICILQSELNSLGEGSIALEYTIPRKGRRADAILLFSGIVFVMEFKVSKTSSKQAAMTQALDYALDLKNFHKESLKKTIVPFAVVTDAEQSEYEIMKYPDNIYYPVCVNRSGIKKYINEICEKESQPVFKYEDWFDSDYYPSPTIIEAAAALYENHSVEEITKKSADAINLSKTTEVIEKIIDDSRREEKKSIVFVTGVPGSGKTLVGLNLAGSRKHNGEDELAVFLSGNDPLVKVLQEALVRDKVKKEKDKKTDRKNGMSKKKALKEVEKFIDMIYTYRKEYFGNNKLPPENVVIFDEAQRAWNHEELYSFMNKKYKGNKKTDEYERDISFSEPGFLISTMDRHEDWSVIVCLVGGGQEINKGEAGVEEWFDALEKYFNDWNIYTADSLGSSEYLGKKKWDEIKANQNININDYLYLTASMRAFRSEKVSEFVQNLISADLNASKAAYEQIKDDYPIRITRNLEEAKAWIKTRARASERYGLLASSGSCRLRPYGVVYSKKFIAAPNWFLNDKDDWRSSFFLETVASEFETQGLELDYALVAWDADFRYENGKWLKYYMNGKGNPPNWSPLKNSTKTKYLTNSYRVLLTRARQGMAIFVPEGVDDDPTRAKEFYDSTYNFLRSIGIPLIENDKEAEE